MLTFRQFSESATISASKKMAKAKDAREYEAAASLKMAAIRHDMHKNRAQGTSEVAKQSVSPYAKAAADLRAKENKDATQNSSSLVQQARAKADAESQNAIARRQQENQRRQVEKQREAARKRAANAVAKY